MNWVSFAFAASNLASDDGRSRCISGFSELPAARMVLNAPRLLKGPIQ